MKKILSVMLAIMMLFGALSIGASAASVQPDYFWNKTVANGVTVSQGTHAILVFDFGEGSSTYGLPVFDTEVNGFVTTDGVSGKYIMLPGSKTDYWLTAASTVKTPYVDAPEGYKFNGWFSPQTGEYYVAGERIVIENSWIGQVIDFEASYIPAKAEGDTMKTVLDILMKVFGTIIGILFFDGSSSAGIELMEKLLGGLLG